MKSIKYKETFSASFAILFKYCRFREQQKHALDISQGCTLESFLDYIDYEVEYAWGHVGSRHELEWSYCGTKRCLILDFRNKFAWSRSPCTSKPRRVSVPAASGLYRAIFPCYCCVPRKSPVSVKSLSSQFLSSTLTSSPPEPHQGYK